MDNFQNCSVHLVGVKGSGMCALAEILAARKARLSGSDTEEGFYTDEILKQLGVPVSLFEETVLDDDVSLLIYSAAYDETNPLIREARVREVAGRLSICSYPEFLGQLSRLSDSSAIAGVHGKTTTAAMSATLVREMALPATVIAGSAVATLDNRCTWNGGEDYLIAETCEYRHHFLHFSPCRIVLTSIESDHQDYYSDYDSIFDAFMEFLRLLPHKGELIYCCDDKGASEAARILSSERPDILLYPYGISAPGRWAVDLISEGEAGNHFSVHGLKGEFELKVPGQHLVLDAVAALCLVRSILVSLGLEDTAWEEVARKALNKFRGSRRRSEIIGEASGILFMDDYGHHPTAISLTLMALKRFYPQRRLVVDFMSHTFSRTAAMLHEFARSFQEADFLILHPVYSSAREIYDGSVSGEDLFRASKAVRGDAKTVYFESFDEAFLFLRGELREGDLFLSLGAGNNRPLTLDLFREYGK